MAIGRLPGAKSDRQVGLETEIFFGIQCYYGTGGCHMTLGAEGEPVARVVTWETFSLRGDKRLVIS